MTNFRTKDLPFSIKQLTRRDSAVGLPAGMLALLSLAACGGGGGLSPTPAPSARTSLEPGVIPFEDATVSGNDTTIDLSGFPSGSNLSTEFGFIGEDGRLTLSDDVFADGTHTITITGFDAAGDALDPQTVVLVSDKTPTIATGLAEVIAVDASTAPILDLAGVFGGGSGELTITGSFAPSFGIIDENGTFSISDGALTENTHTITFTATDEDGDAVEETVEFATDKKLAVVNAVQDATVVGNDTIIDLSAVFANDGEAFTIAASLGVLENNTLTLSDDVFTEGAHTITITATSGEVAALHVFVLVSDKTPTINTAVSALDIIGNDGTDINLMNAFGGGSGTLTYKTTYNNTVINAIGDTLTLPDGTALNDGANTIIVTATDSDNDTVTMDITINADKSPTVILGAEIGGASIEGNGDTIINVGGVFGHPAAGEVLALSSLDGTITDGSLTLVGADFQDGKNTITLTATDSDSSTPETVTSTFVLTVNKHPTILTAVSALDIDGNGGTDINLMNAFGGGSGTLTYKTTYNNTVIDAIGDTLTLPDGTALNDGANTIIVTATDNNSDSITMDITINVDKSPTVNVGIVAANIEGNGDTIINVSGVFGHPTAGEVLTLSSLDGTITDGSLTLVGADFEDGKSTITLTATDSDSLSTPETVTSTFVLTVNKHPTILTAVSALDIDGNGGTEINLMNAFGGGSGTLTYKTTYNNTLINAIGDTLTLPDGDGLIDGANTIIVTATDNNSDSITMDITINVDKSPTVNVGIVAASIEGNGDTIINVGGVFGHPTAGETLTLSSLDGTITDGSLTLVGADFQDGKNTITLTATDSDSLSTPETVTSTFVLTVNKHPTILTAVSALDIDGNNGTEINLMNAFGGGSGTLTYKTIYNNTVINATGNILTLADGAGLNDGPNTITVTATDNNSDSITMDITINVDKSPTVILGAEIGATSIEGNGDKIINVGGVFGHPTAGENLTLSSMDGTITDGSLTLVGADLEDGTRTITLTATDTDSLSTPETVTSTFVLTVNKHPTILTAVSALDIIGNDGTEINLMNAFGGGSGTLTYKTTYNNTVINAIGDILTLPDGAGLNNGANTIIVTATDNNSDSITMDITINVDKTPTVKTPINDLSITDNGGTTINVGDVFGHPVVGEVLDLSTTLGTITNGTLTIMEADIPQGIYTITLMATDGDATNKDSITSTFVLTSDKSPTINSVIADMTLTKGNSGTIIDVSSVFGHPAVGETLTLSASIGTIGIDKSLTLTGDDLDDGMNTIILTAIDADSLSTPETVTTTFVLTTDKTPTIAKGLASKIAVTAGTATVIDLDEVFKGGSGELTITTSYGTIVGGNMLSLSAGDLNAPVHTVTVVATDNNGDAVQEIVELVTDKVLVVGNALQDETVEGNDTTIDLTGVFNGTETFTLATSFGTISNDVLILSDAVFTEGVHTITITATSALTSYVAEQTFVLVSDKSPTIDTPIVDAHIAGNGGTTINLAGLFANGTSPLTLTTSHGVVGPDGSLTIADGDDLDDGMNIIIITATDDDITDKDSVTSTFVITTDKSPTLNMGAEVRDESITGNLGTTIDISTVFSGGSGDLTLSASAGTIGDGSLTLNGNDLVDGRNIIIITATDDDATGKDSITDTFIITTNKSPTVANTVIDVNIDGNGGTIIDLSEVFDNGGGQLTLTSASAGALGKDQHLTLYAHDLVDKTNSFTITAADTDTPTAETVITTFNIITTKELAILAGADNYIYDATQHHTATQPTQTFNLARVFGIPDDTTFSFTTASSGINLSGSTLIFDNTDTTLKTGKHLINITATNDDITVSRVLTYTVDTIQSQTITGAEGSSTIYNGSTDPDMITGNSFDAGNNIIFGILFDGGAGDDTISSNTISSDNSMIANNFEGGAGDDTISSNIFTAVFQVISSTLDGGDGDDTISSNTFTGQGDIDNITLDGGAGNDTISDNSFKTTGRGDNDEVNRIALIGGAGDDLFRNNFATQSNGKSASLTIEGGDGEDTVVFRSVASEYAGLSQWINGVTTVILTGDGARVRMVDVETISFADGASYNAADAWVQGSEETLYDLDKAFPSTEATFTAYSTDSGTITGKTLTLSGTELSHGANTVVVTATANDLAGTETTETITVNVVKTLKINGAKQHNEQTFDLGDIFVETDATTYTALNLPSGVTLDEGTLTFNNTLLGAEDHPITIAATDGYEALTLTLNYALDTIKGQSGNTSNTTYSGTTLADTISDNLFDEPTYALTNIDLDGGAGNDTFSDNHFVAHGQVLVNSNIYDVFLIGGAGDDVFRHNTAFQTGERARMTIDGGEGTDKVYFELPFNNGIADLFSVTGAYGSTITVTDSALRSQDNGGSIDSYAQYYLENIEELYFGGSDTAYVF